MMAGTQWLEREKGLPRLAYRVHPAQGTARGAVLLSHGFAEHSQCYSHVIAAWCARGYLVASFDYRGHGRSEGPRGHITDYREYVDDLRDMLASLRCHKAWAAFEKPILFAHSTGALATLLVAHEDQAAYAGVALSSPYMELAVPVSPLLHWFVKAVVHVYPQFSEPSPLDPERLTRDPVMAERILQDSLRVRRVTAGFYIQTAVAQQEVFRIAPEITLPVFALVGGDDPIARASGTLRLFERLGSKEKDCILIAGDRHEVLNEVDRVEHIETYAKKFDEWVGTRKK